MKVVITIDSLKGSLSSMEAGMAIKGRDPCSKTRRGKLS